MPATDIFMQNPFESTEFQFFSGSDPRTPFGHWAAFETVKLIT